MRTLRTASAFAILSAALVAACSGSTDNETKSMSVAGSGASSSSTSVASSGSGGAATGGGGAGGATSSSSAASTTSTGGSGGMGGADIGQPSTKHPAITPDTPKVENYGGPRLTQPKIVPVYFADYDATLEASVEDLESKIGATQYWSAATKEYGIGAATALTPVVLTETAPTNIDDSGIQTWLAGKLNGDDPAWPAADANTVYVLHYPETTTIVLQSSTSCQQFGGYHSSTALDANHGSINTAYAVIPSCSNFAGMSLLDATTSTETHELIEAVTDPYPDVSPAYAEVDEAHIYWERILGGGEIGDMCAQFQSSFVVFPELPYMVQRTWSNQNAHNGHDPCQPPIAGEIYFNAQPKLTDNITGSIFGQMVTFRGVKIAVGASKTIDVDLFSDADTGGPWTVAAEDLASTFNGGAPDLTFSFDADAGQNGQTLHLTITVMKAGKNNTESFILKSTLGSDEHSWIGIVGSD